MRGAVALIGESGPDFAHHVFLPCSNVRPGDEEMSIDLHRTDDGKLALLVYSSLEILVECCGERQAWVQVPTTDLDRIQSLTGFELFLIDACLDGRPDQVHATSRWLRDQLAFEVNAGAASLRSADADAAEGWRGVAGTAFQGRVSTDATRATELHAGIVSAADGLSRYADQLAIAQGHMARAREIAAGASLPINGQTILEPGAPPAVPDLPADGRATPALLAQQDETMSAYQRQVDAYNLAQGEAQKGRAAMNGWDEFLKNMKDDANQKWHLMGADFVNGGVYGGIMAKRAQDVRKAAEAAKVAAARHVDDYLKATGGSAASRAANNAAFAKHMDFQNLDNKATGIARRAGSKIPLVGLGVTAAGIGYDIAHGKPVTKAVISGVGGAGAAVVVGMIVGSAAGPLGTVAGAALGGLVGTAVSSGLDMLYDHRQEIADFAGGRVDDAREAVTEHVQAVGRSLDNTADALGDGAKKMFNAIF
jgi:hypothetical protein